MSKRKAGPNPSQHSPRGRRATTVRDPRQWLSDLIKAYHAGRFDEVIAGAERFAKQWPDQVVGWNLLAEGYRMAGRLGEAEATCRRALEIAPQNAEAHNNSGNVFRDQDDGERAEDAYRRALAIKPNLVEACFNLANLLRAQGRFQEAVPLYRKAVSQRPDEYQYHYVLGSALLEVDDYESARGAFESAVAIRPDQAEAHNELGRVLRELGKFERARRSCERAIELQPEFAQAHANLGAALRVMGEMDEAEHSIRRSLQLRPGYPWGWYMLATTRKLAASDTDLAELERAREQSEPGSSDRMLLDFALGRAYSDAGRAPDVVFPCYREGCEIKRGQIDYNAEDTRHHFDAIARTFSRDWIQRMEGTGDATDAPVFVVGMPRSGTTLVEQILASHPEVHGAGECTDLGRLVASKSAAAGVGYPDWADDMPGAELSLLGAHYRRRVVDPALPARRVVDKMPANFLYLGLIARALPNARVVHMQRDPVDTCLSCYMQLFTRAQWFSYDLEELGLYYQAYAKLMAHWRNVLPPGFMLEFPYEDLIDDPEPQVRRLLEHCGLEWDSACLDFHETRRAVRTASLTQVRQPLYRGSVGKWHKYGGHLQPLLDALGPLVTNEADHAPDGDGSREPRPS